MSYIYSPFQSSTPSPPHIPWPPSCLAPSPLTLTTDRSHCLTLTAQCLTATFPPLTLTTGRSQCLKLTGGKAPGGRQERACIWSGVLSTNWENAHCSFKINSKVFTKLQIYKIKKKIIFLKENNYWS